MSNVGFASLQVIPSFKGIQAGLSKELGGAAEIAAAEAGTKASASFASKLAGGLKKTGAGLAVAGGIGLAVGTGLFKIGDAFDTAFDKIRVGTGKLGPQLEGLKGDFRAIVRDVPTDFGSASTAVTELNQRLGLTGKPLVTLGEQFAQLSHITGTDLSTNIASVSELFNNFGVGIDQQPAKLDALFRASQATGVSIADLSKSMADGGPVLRQIGLGFNESAAFVGLLGKAGVETGSVMPALSKSIAAAAKDGKSAGQVFQETFAAIKAAPSDTAAAGVAISVFGQRAGPRLAGLIREGKLSIADLTNTIATGKDTITTAAADTADFSEKFQIFKNKALLAIEPIATRVFNLVGSLIDKFNGLSPGMQQAILIGGGLVLVFGTIAAAITVLGPGIAAIGAGIALLASPVTLIVVGVAALAAGAIYAYTHFKVFHDIVDAFGRAIAATFGFIADHWPLLLAILTGPIGLAVLEISRHWDGIKNAVGAVIGFVRDHWQALLAILTGPIGIAVKLIHDHFDSIVGFVTGMPGRIASAASGMWDGIKNAFKAVINTIIGWWNGLHFGIPKIHVPGTPIDVGGETFRVPQIPKLHGGGVFLAPEGRGEGLALLRSGETVLTAPQASSLGLNSDGGALRPLVVHTHVLLDGREVGESVDTHMLDTRRGATRA